METKLQLVTGNGPLRGFRNMLKIEASQWLNIKKLATQSLSWLFAVNFIVAMPLLVAPMVDPTSMVTLGMASEIFIGIFSMVIAVGTVIVMQSSLVGEKQSGTAAWILTNPVTRTSFILSKLVANTLGLGVVALGLQGVVGYVIMSSSLGYSLPVKAYLVVMGLQGLHMLLYLTFTLALGAFFNSRGPILGVAIMFTAIQDLLGGFVGGILPWFPMVLPNQLNYMSIAVNMGQSIPSVMPIVATTIYTLAFIGLAIWRFKRTEF
jgi:ABC-2 type transport system permease protein